MLKKVPLLILFLFLAMAAQAQSSFIKVIKRGNDYRFEIPDSILGAPVLFGSRVVDISSPSAKVYSAGQMRRPPELIRFARRGNLLVIEQLTDFVDVDPADPVFDPLMANMRVGAVQYFDIESRNAADDASVINVTKYFSDEVQLAWPLPDNVRKGRLDPKLSRLLFMKEYDDRVNIRSYYEFTGGKETFTITVQYFLLKLPREPLRGRYNDERIGYQPHNRKAYSAGNAISTNRYISRWRIEPAAHDMQRHASGQLVEPKEPIVVYVEPYFPAPWIPYIKEGIEVWNQAFEKIGFKNVLQAREFPVNDPHFDPYDIKTFVVRYLPLNEANAAGQIWTDPRSGEIIHGEVLWWKDVVNLLTMWRFTQTAAVDPAARAVEPQPEAMGEMVRYAIAHEVGHMLGLQHNLRSSYAFPVDSLRCPEFTGRNGTTPSIMDYARNNHVAQPGDLERGVRLTPPHLGAFDIFSVEYGYMYIHGASTPDEERPVLDSLFATRAGNPVYKFAPFIAAAVSPDPSAQTESLGNDVIRSSNYGILNTRVILDNLIEWTTEGGGDIAMINRRYDALSRQYFRYISLSMSYIGGVYTRYGPLSEERIRQVPVEKKKQKEALDFVIRQLREAPVHLDQSQFTPIIGSKRDHVLKAQSDVVAYLLNAFILPRVLANTTFGPQGYTLEEYLSDLDAQIWKTFCTSSVYDKNIQITYVQNLAAAANLKPGGNLVAPGRDAIIAEAAYTQLLKTKKYLERKKRRTSSGSKAHYSFLLDLIEKAG